MPLSLGVIYLKYVLNILLSTYDSLEYLCKYFPKENLNTCNNNNDNCFTITACVLTCSGHGHCDPITKRCICYQLWMENLIQQYLTDGESNCGELGRMG